MTTKEYLSQAFHIDHQINSKLEQLQALRDLATKTTSPMNDMPGSPTRNVTKMEDAVIKIIALSEEINNDVDRLVDLKIEITHAIKKVDDVECALLLELRYLCFKTWEQIAVELGYDIRHVYRLHQLALQKITIPESEQ